MNKHTKIHTWVAEIDFLNTYVTIIQWDRWLNTKMILVVDISDGVEFCIKSSTTLVKWINGKLCKKKAEDQAFYWLNVNNCYFVFEYGRRKIDLNFAAFFCFKVHN